MSCLFRNSGQKLFLLVTIALFTSVTVKLSVFISYSLYYTVLYITLLHCTVLYVLCHAMVIEDWLWTWLFACTVEIPPGAIYTALHNSTSYSFRDSLFWVLFCVRELRPLWTLCPVGECCKWGRGQGKLSYSCSLWARVIWTHWIFILIL